MNLSDVEAMRLKGDIKGLQTALRDQDNPAVRAEAAKALGALLDVNQTELLVRCVQEDPDPDVRQAALQALQEMFGLRMNEVLSGYAAAPPSDSPWLIFVEKDGFTIKGADLKAPDAWDSGVIAALLDIVNSDRDEEERLKAVEALGNMRNTHAVEVLQRIAVHPEDEKASEAARQALQSFFGEDTDAMVEAFFQREQEEEDEEEGEEEGEYEEEEEYPEPEPFSYASSYPEVKHYASQSPVVREEKSGLALILIVMLVLMGLGLAIAVVIFSGSFLR